MLLILICIHHFLLQQKDRKIKSELRYAMPCPVLLQTKLNLIFASKYRADSLKTNTLRDLFRSNQTPVYFIDWCLFSGIGMEEWIGNVQFICATDTFDGRHPQVVAPDSFIYNHKHSSEEINNALLANAAIRDHIRSRDSGKALLWMLDQQTERLAAEIGLEICLPPVSLRHYWDHKGNTNRMAENAGVPCVPYLLSPLTGYDHLRQIARHLGERLVLQAPYGNSGSTTFFIDDEAGFERHRSDLTNGQEIRIMRRIDCRSTGLEACVTRHGTVTTPLVPELVGLPELTVSKGGWCGNELYPGAFPKEISRQAREYTLKMGEELRKVGFRGYFQLDFLIDKNDETLYLGEMNPRLSGITPLINNASFSRNGIPLLLVHLAEWMYPDHALNVNELNECFMDESGWEPLSFLHINNVTDEVAHSVPTGIYRRQPDGQIGYARPAVNPAEIAGPDEIFWFSSAGKYSDIGKGEEIGALFMPARATGEDGQLTEAARSWVAGVKSCQFSVVSGQ